MKQKSTADLLGILGGLGPMATAWFYDLLTTHTEAQNDADHIDLVISSRATTPDRTAFILGKSTADPRVVMIEDAKRLCAFGCDLIAIPCNTAHYFYESIQAAVDVPILNIMKETSAYLKNCGICCAGVLATDGTVQSGTYERYLKENGIRCVTPDEARQADVMTLIYDQIKKGKSADYKLFSRAAEYLFGCGAEAVILGCTELSLIKRDHPLPTTFVDSMEVLAKSTILACGKTPCNFSF